MSVCLCMFLFFKQKTAYEMRISDWSSDVCSSDLVDSSVLAFEIASRAAFREGIPKAGPVLLEPMMKVEVVTPEEYMGDIIGDLNSRRGSVLGMDSRGNAQVINAMVPLANMFGYVNTLRSMSQGRAQRSEERRVGKEGVSTCRSWWSPDP